MPGLEMSYFKFKPKERSTIDLDKLTAVSKKVVPDLDLSSFKNERMFGLRYTGFIDIPEDGIYTISSMAQGGESYIQVHGLNTLENKGGEEKRRSFNVEERSSPV